MSKLKLKGYNKFLKEIKDEIEQRRYKALQTVNKALIELYWEIGRRIVKMQEKSGWGEAIVENLAKDISAAFPDTKGFSERNLWNMKQYYLAYRCSRKLQTLSAEISWSNNILILSETNSQNEREFYLKLCIREKWSYRELKRQIDTDFFTRCSNFKNANKTLSLRNRNTLVHFKDHYVLDFLGLKEVYSEKQFRKAILGNLRQFFLEFGKGFSFVGEEYPLKIGDDIFKIDLLFYHRDLRCLIPVELKLSKFKPEYIGKMQFYLAALDEQTKLTHENPSIGLILCKSKNDETVKLAISQAARKIGIATYQTKLVDTKLVIKKLRQIELPE